MNKMSWPTALILSVIIVSAVFAHSKSITLNSNSNGVIVASSEQVWRLRDGQVRKCPVSYTHLTLPTKRIV